jgi:microcystin-dependent protein
MSISSEVRKSPLYMGNGTTTVFSFSFKVFSIADVSVIKSTNGVETTLVLGSDYTVSLNANQDAQAGGSVTLSVSPSSADTIVITSSVSALQPVTLGGTFYPQVINDALDRLTILVQQVKEKMGRAIAAPITSNVDPTSYLSSIFIAANNASDSAASAATSAAVAEAAAASLGNDPNFATTITNDLATKAPLSSPALTGTPTAPTAAAGTSTTQLATTEFVTTAVPAGLISFFTMTSAPTGWLKANGASISRTTYASLFAAIGTTFGAGDGSTTFNLPDLRGEFLRGFDNGRGIDTATVSSWSYSGSTITVNTSTAHGLVVGSTGSLSGLTATTNAPNGTFVVVSVPSATQFTFTASATPTGTAGVNSATVNRLFGSLQIDTVQSHGHAIKSGWSNSGWDPGSCNGNSNAYVGTNNGCSNALSTVLTPTSDGVNGNAKTSAETRPRNIALLACIKY